jgi:hypothetical protein
MSFEDLPKGWARRPITDEAIFADVIDLVVTDRDRANGAIYVILCAPDGRMVQPCAVTDVDRLAAADRREPFEAFAQAAAERMPGGGIVVAIARSGRVDTVDSDREWHEAAISVCRAHGVRLLAVAVSTPRRVWRLPERPQAARSA